MVEEGLGALEVLGGLVVFVGRDIVVQVDNVWRRKYGVELGSETTEDDVCVGLEDGIFARLVDCFLAEGEAGIKVRRGEGYLELQV